MGVDTTTGLFGMPNITLGNILFNYVFRYVMMASTKQLNLLSKLPPLPSFFGGGNIPDAEDAVGARDKRIARTQFIEMLFLPFVFVFYLISLVLFYPCFLVPAMLRALYRRAVVGRPSEFFKTDMQGPYNKSPDYPCQFVFTKPFEPARLKTHFYELANEGRIPEALARIEFPTEEPAGIPATNAFAADHYTSEGAQIGPDANLFSYRMAALNTDDACIVLRCHNGAPGGVTVLNAFLPGGAWDGSSCFNFVKELIHRYCGGTPNSVFAAEELTLKEEAAAKLDETTNFVAFLQRLPFYILSNMSDFMWQFYRSQPLLGGAGLLPRINVLNFDEATSDAIAKGALARGAKPYAAFVWAATCAFKKVKGYYPYGVIQQSSMQSRAYDPTVVDRNLIGDWLIGPFRHIRTICKLQHSEFTLAMSQQQYDALIKELGHGTSCGTLGGAVGEACEAKHYGLINWGAAVFEFFPFYPVETKILDSLFLNNYGIREIHPDAGLVSFNWAAPTGLALNTMCVNGKTCSAFGTSVHTQDELDAIRDEAEALLLSLTTPPPSDELL